MIKTFFYKKIDINDNIFLNEIYQLFIMVNFPHK